MSENTKMVPAVCTQCGGSLDVDPTQETAKCPFCGMTFVVEKAINNYKVQHATIEHADNVTVDMGGAAKSFFDFAGKQMSESREAKKELKKQEQAFSHDMMRLFFKVFAGIFVIGVVAMILMNLFDIGEDEPEKAAVQEEETGGLTYDVDNGYLYVDVYNPGEYEWYYVSDPGETTVLTADDYDEDGYHFDVAAATDNNMGYAIFAEYPIGDEDAETYYIFELDLADNGIVEVVGTNAVSDLDRFDFIY